MRYFNWSNLATSSGTPFKFRLDKTSRLTQSRWWLHNTGAFWFSGENSRVWGTGWQLEHFVRVAADASGASGSVDVKGWSTCTELVVGALGGVVGPHSSYSRTPSISYYGLPARRRFLRSSTDTLIISSGYIDGSIHWQQPDGSKTDVRPPLVCLDSRQSLNASCRVSTRTRSAWRP